MRRAALASLAMALTLSPTVALTLSPTLSPSTRAPTHLPRLQQISVATRRTGISGPPSMRLSGGGFGGGGGGGGGGFDFRSLVPPLIFGALLASGVLSGIFYAFVFLFVVVPLVAVPAFQWYVSNNLLEGTCPECAAPVQVFKGQMGVCSVCGARISDELGSNSVFMRKGAARTDSGVVEVDAVVVDDD